LAGVPTGLLFAAMRFGLLEDLVDTRPRHPALQLIHRFHEAAVDDGSHAGARRREREVRCLQPFGNVEQQRARGRRHACPPSSTALVYTSCTSSSDSSASRSFCIFAESSPDMAASVAGFIVTSPSSALKPAFSRPARTRANSCGVVITSSEPSSLA